MHPPETKRLHPLLEGFYRLYQRHDGVKTLLDEAAKLAVEFFQVQQCAIAWLAEGKPGFSVLVSSGAKPTDDFVNHVGQAIAAHRRQHPAAERGSAHVLPVAAAGTPDPREFVLPVQVSHRIAGYLYARQSKLMADEALLALLARHIGAAVETQRMRELLASRYAAPAGASNRGEAAAPSVLGTPILAAVETPGKVANIVARAFYKELRKAGFETKQILMVATALIENLTEALRRASTKKQA
ncbi:MAG: GAF domain-containing protein [candidate division KSB1 bacterium]|nr:GAF domain-containing protein [candidate division KSB1 bacterium]MDZ7276579.1 GAF domain-containing protein [candidate division KSB1 bacterium]MDZ7288248.1 GAF domain-containing protein [candidate division KSB1 bacterium]MDZ7300361.1 GAF domain-containing protein [candidate division KSB1 bacterium]MDZ7351361.1 GAF domain-containing protein [candidate division KSB1 bacterium]